MAERNEQGIVPTGFELVDAFVNDVVSDESTLASIDMRRLKFVILGHEKDTDIGSVEYERGEEVFKDIVRVGSSGLLDEVQICRVDHRELPDGYIEKATKLWRQDGVWDDEAQLPSIVGWDLRMTFGLLSLDNGYRKQRYNALYPNDQRANGLSDNVRISPFTVISPVLGMEAATMGPTPTEMLGMFGCYTTGGVLAAEVNFERYPYMRQRSFEDAEFMQGVVEDFLKLSDIRADQP